MALIQDSMPRGSRSLVLQSVHLRRGSLSCRVLLGGHPGSVSYDVHELAGESWQSIFSCRELYDA